MERSERARWAAAVGGALACALLPLPGFVALLAGVALAAVGAAPSGSHAAGQLLLKASVVALGAGIELGVVVRAGLGGLGTAAATLALAIGAGVLLARWLRIERDVALLITVGTAICGGSAIAAAAPVVRARPAAVGLAIGVVFLLNAVALLLFPWLGDRLGLTPAQFGEWCALAIHDTSSVVGAAATRGPEALELATVMKLGRALWIVPVCAGLAIAERRATKGASGRSERTEPLRLPWFILAFVGLAALVALWPAAAAIGPSIASVGRRGLVAALFAVGLATDHDALRSIRARHLALGVLLWAALAGGALLLV